MPQKQNEKQFTGYTPEEFIVKAAEIFVRVWCDYLLKKRVREQKEK